MLHDDFYNLNFFNQILAFITLSEDTLTLFKNNERLQKRLEIIEIMCTTFVRSP